MFISKKKLHRLLTEKGHTQFKRGWDAYREANKQGEYNKGYDDGQARLIFEDFKSRYPELEAIATNFRRGAENGRMKDIIIWFSNARYGIYKIDLRGEFEFLYFPCTDVKSGGDVNG